MCWVTDNMPMVYRIAWQHKQRAQVADFDDLVSEGSIGLMDAAEAFEPSRGVTFPMFAYRRVWGAMQDWIRRETGQRASRPDGRRTRVVASQSLDSVDPDFGPQTDPATSPVAVAERHDFWNRIEDVVGERGARFLFWRYHEGLSQSQCAVREGYSKSWASLVEGQYLATLRRSLGESRGVDLLPTDLERG